MKFSLLALALVASSSHAFVSQSSPKAWTSVSTRLQAGKKLDSAAGDWWAPAAVVVAGWAVAAQATFAAPAKEIPPMPLDTPVIEEVVSSSSAYSNLMLISAPLETLDFSMPSYDSSSKSSPTKIAPAFTNPFGSSSDEPSEPEEAAGPTKAEKKAAQEAEKQRKADEKAEADAKKAEEKAAKEARKKEQLELQKASVERSKQKDDEAAPSLPISMPDFKAPEMPDVKIPEFKAPAMPDFKAPDVDVKLPEFKAPDFKVPDFKAPSIPDFKAPESFKAPDIKLDMPKAPSFDGKLDMPKAPSFDGKLDMPKVDMPKVEMPKMAIFDGGSTSSDGSVLAPQEVRDETARQARNDFLAADDDAKIVEKQARELRNRANDKKKVASEKKDEACETRWGGKIVCLRPLNSGY